MIRIGGSVNTSALTRDPMRMSPRHADCESQRVGAQRAVEPRSITINVNDSGSTAPRPLPPAGVGPNFAETMKTR